MVDMACLFIYCPNNEFSTSNPECGIYFSIFEALFGKKTGICFFLRRIHNYSVSDQKHHFIRVFVFPRLSAWTSFHSTGKPIK